MKMLWDIIKEKECRDVAVKGIILDIKTCTTDVIVAVLDDGTAGGILIIATNPCLEKFLGKSLDDARCQHPDSLKNEVTERRIARAVTVSGDAVFDGDRLVMFVRDIGPLHEDFDKLVEEEKKAHGEELHALIGDVAEGIEKYGDDFFDN